MGRHTESCDVLGLALVLSLMGAAGAFPADAPRGGVGIMVGTTPEGNTLVQAVLPGGPADLAGLKTGDLILSVSGKSLAGLSTPDAAGLIGGPPGSEVELRVRHPSGEEATIKIKRAPLTAPGSSAQGPGPAGQAPPATRGVLKLRKGSIRDALAGMDAVQVLVPEGWQVDGGVVWLPDRPAVPADITVRVRNPGGLEEYSLFPGQLFTWSPLLAQAIPQGQKYLGCEVVRPVDGPLAALKMIVAPRFRPELGNRYQLIAETELPRLAQAAAPMYQRPGGPVVVRAGRIRIQYPIGDRQQEEDLTCVFVASKGPAGEMWALDKITSFRAEKGKLDEQMPLFETIAFSVRPTLDWFDQYTAISQLLVQGFYQTQAQIMERARIHREASQQVSETIRRTYEARQAAMDRIARNYDEKAVRGVQAYLNPLDGSRVEVPNEYDHVWTNPSGQYIYSNRSSYNPNIGSNLHWQELEKAK